MEQPNRLADVDITEENESMGEMARVLGPGLAWRSAKVGVACGEFADVVFSFVLSFFFFLLALCAFSTFGMCDVM